MKLYTGVIFLVGDWEEEHERLAEKIVHDQLKKNDHFLSSVKLIIQLLHRILEITYISVIYVNI